MIHDTFHQQNIQAEEVILDDHMIHNLSSNLYRHFTLVPLTFESNHMVVKFPWLIALLYMILMIFISNK